MSSKLNQFNKAMSQLSGLRAKLVEVTSDRELVAQKIAIGEANPADWSPVQKAYVDQSSLIGLITQYVETLREEARKEAEAERVSGLMEQHRTNAAAHAQVWNDRQNAARIFAETLEHTPQFARKQEHTNGNGRYVTFSDDLAMYVVPQGLVQRCFVAGKPNWIVVDEGGFARWIVQNALALLHRDEVEARIRIAKSERNRMQSQPAQINLMNIGA